jgi:hypothetical protein
MRKRNIFFIVWLLTTVGFVWLISQEHRTFDSPATLPVLIALLVCTVALQRWLPSPVRDELSEQASTNQGWFALMVIMATGVLFLSRTVIGPPLLFAWPFLAVVVLMCLKPQISKREVAYALVLAFVAGITGLGAGWVPFSPVVWAILQAGLVFTGFLAGWATLRHTGLWEARVGRSRFLDDGVGSALRGFLLGILIATPWALGIVLLGGAESEQWVQDWWQPFIAISAGIGEEAWGRVFPIPLLFLLLRRVSRPRPAYVAALVVISYWFAYLHTAGGLDELVSTVMIGTLYVLPVSYICLHRDLETAIGFHFWVDFVKFAAALLLVS